ncbi:MAG: CoA-binding protein [Calditrichaeota bacterium]|nr:CoA-binding protein [Calditrichota bacterium]
MESIWRRVNQNIPEILKRYRRVAVVGISNKSYRPSYDIARYLLNRGFTIYPVNPNYEEVMGLRCYDNLKEIEGTVEIVDIFRRSDRVLPVVEEAIEIGAKVIWMQMGVINEEAAERALSAGLEVVMDMCIKVELAGMRLE